MNEKYKELEKKHKDYLIPKEEIQANAENKLGFMVLSAVVINHEIIETRELIELLKKYSLEHRWMGYHFSNNSERINLLREWGIKEKDLKIMKMLNKYSL